MEKVAEGFWFTPRSVRGEDLDPIPTALDYRQSNPYAVMMSFNAQNGVVVWELSRTLLTEGAIHETVCGDGDVACWSQDTQYFIRLSSPDGEVVLWCDLDDMSDFLDATYELVPMGMESEYIDMDQVVQELLGG